MRKLSENILDKISIDFLRNQVLKNAYGNDDTVIAKLDPRILLVWYLFFGLVPWFLNDVVLLLGIFVFVALTTRAAKIAPLVLFLFCVGVFSQTGYLFIVALFFGGNTETIAPLLVMTLKVAVVSLASITVFSGLDPDRLANGLLWYGCPGQLSFSISFAYRILPVLMEEFQNILLSQGRPPQIQPQPPVLPAQRRGCCAHLLVPLRHRLEECPDGGLPRLAPDHDLLPVSLQDLPHPVRYRCW